jgi:hypothetical protein
MPLNLAHHSAVSPSLSLALRDVGADDDDDDNDEDNEDE